MSKLTKSQSIVTYNPRRHRAQLLTSTIMRALDAFIPSYVRREAADELFRLFHDMNAEIIGPEDRRRAGLPPLDECGLSPIQHAEMELALTRSIMSTTRHPVPAGEE